MALLSQSIRNLLNGISQKAAVVRPDSQGEIQENCLSSRVHGLRRRPPTRHIAKLGDVIAGDGDTDIGIPPIADDFLGDWDADNAVTSPVVGVQAWDYGATANWTGVTSIPNSGVTAGPLLSRVGDTRLPGFFDVANYPSMALDLNGHAFIRHWGDIGSVSPGVLSAVAPASGAAGLTIIGVVRSGGVISSSMARFLEPSTDAPLVGFGNGSIGGVVGGGRRGLLLGETGEYYQINSPPVVLVDAGSTYPGLWPVGGPTRDTHIYQNDSTPEPVHGFAIIACRISGGVLTFYKNGFALPNTFTMPAGTYNVGTFILDGYFDWSRMLCWVRGLTNTELLNATRNLGLRYAITTA